MKKALALILALMMVLSLAACGGEPTETKGPENQIGRASCRERV